MHHKYPSVIARLALVLLACGSVMLRAQSTLDTGSLRGRVLDSSGKALPGAIVRAKGPQGAKASETDSAGNYNIPFLVPGAYEVTVTMDGYSTQVQNGVAIVAQQISGQTFKLSEGSETVIVKAGNNVDTHSTTATTRVNLTEAVQVFAQDHSLTAAFDFAPGAIKGSGVGGGNYSISGASGLENQYFVGGVNITSSGYGAIGTYDVVRGATGTGLTTQFLENLDIREGGFEAEYGGALGGVISATVRSGSNDWHGGVSAYYTPRSLDGGRVSFDRPGGFFNTLGETTLDMALELGGPIVKDRLFFFVGYNPVWRQDFEKFSISDSDLAKDKIVAPFANAEYDYGRNRVDNYALHLTWNASSDARHRFDLTIFGSPQSMNGKLRAIGRRVDPSTDAGIPIYPASATGVRPTSAYDGALGSLNVRDYSAAVKYFGSFSSWLNVEASVAYHRSQVIEKPSAMNALRYSDQRRVDIYNAQTRGGYSPIVSPSIYTFGGVGFHQGGSNDDNLNYTLKVTHNFNFAGSHELKWGADYADLKYREDIEYTGPKPEVFLNGGNPDGYAVLRTGTQITVRCFSIYPNSTTIQAACAGSNQRYRAYRGNFNPPTPDTRNQEMNLFLQDKWTIKNVTLNLGLRWTRDKISNPSSYTLRSSRTGRPLVDPQGNPVGSRNADCAANNDFSPSCYLAGPGVYVGTSYQFRGELSPRIGLSWDILGDGKSKLYANYARLYERVPNDLAVRSFGNEFGVSWLPYDFPDLSRQTTSARVTGSQPTRVAPGTRLPYKDDFALGYQFSVNPGYTVDIKANFRKQGRILEDTQAATVEAIQNYYYNGYLGAYRYYCMNCAPGQTELFPGAGSAPFGEYVLANIGENAPASFRDSVTGLPHAVTFGRPESKYKALSITLTKIPAEGEHLSLQASYRISKVLGNYEGLYRNDNGQSDPNITSLFDFPDSPLLHTQYTNGLLNTDTPHSLKVNIGYSDIFIKNLSGAVTFKWQSGQPRTPQLAHPVYQNAGEIPGLNPQYYIFDIRPADGFADTYVLKSYTPVARGYLGRNPGDAIWDVKLGYKLNLGKSNLDFSILVSNLFNETHVNKFDDDVESTAGVLNPFYGLPQEAHTPRTIRLGAKWSF